MPANLAEPKEIVDAVRKWRGGALLNLDRQMFEFVAAIAAYNMVSRVLVAIDVQPE